MTATGSSRATLSLLVVACQTVRDLARITAHYARFLGDLRARVATARLSAARAVNRELIELCWDICKAIVDEQQPLGWGKSIVEQIARDLRKAFPGAMGLSARNAWDMRRLCDECAHHELLRQLVAEVPSGHHLMIMNTFDEPRHRLHHLRATAAFGGSRNVLPIRSRSVRSSDH